MIAADPKINGTSAMWKHNASCFKKQNVGTSQPKLTQEGSGILTSWTFNQARARIALCKYIILDELPFRSVEQEGFKLYTRELQPMFNIPCSYTVRADCLKMFLEHKEQMKVFFNRRGMGRVSITTVCWSAINNTNYICVTAHCIDKEWRLHKKIISFTEIDSHKGGDIAASLVRVLAEWGIERFFSCILDNASANDVAMRHMISTLNEKNMLVANGKYLHQRCVAHILNLVVCEGLEEIGMSVRRVREAVKWIKASSPRSDSFKDIAKLQKVDISKFLSLDVPTRWNSTYLMLEAALPYEPVMKLFETWNPDFVRDMNQRKHNDLSIGVPNEQDWIEVKRMCGFLEKFYDLTRLVSGSKYVTAHQFFMELCDTVSVIKDLENNADNNVQNMATKMKKKLAKYWLEEKELNPKMNNIIYLAVMLDPKQKMKHVQHCLKTVYSKPRANIMVDNKPQFLLLQWWWKFKNLAYCKKQGTL